jgi:hypothetical protein
VRSWCRFVSARRFAAADTVAAFGLHGALFVGPRHTIALAKTGEWFDALSTFRITLMRNGAGEPDSPDQIAVAVAALETLRSDSSPHDVGLL